MSHANSDDQDWFDQDEDEILQSLQSKVAQSESAGAAFPVEHIQAPSAADKYLQQRRLEVSTELSLTDNVDHVKRLTTPTLRKLKNMESLDLFLFVTTSDPNFFVGQISASDGLDRTILYLRIWSRLFELQLHAFHKEFLEAFSQNEVFLEQIRVMAVKLFRQSFKTIWKNVEEIDVILYDIKSLILRLHKAKLIAQKVLEIVTDIRKFIKEGDYEDILKLNSCKQLELEFDSILNGDEMQLGEKIELYPSLEELMTTPSLDTEANISLQYIDTPEKDVRKYIAKQKQILRDDFILPLREFVCQIKDNASHPIGLYSNVCIVLNKDFTNARRHKMLFIDVSALRDANGGILTTPKSIITAIKTGSLLVLTSSRNFENLILATVTYTDAELLSKGYIGIEILRQYNIKNVYDRCFLMFESPAFFEAYNSVYNYFDTHEDEELPMKRYIVDGEKVVRPPNYLKPGMAYKYGDETFNVINASKKCKPQKLPLNPSQWAAYTEALSKEFCLIQGPPGTGKTHLSVHLVRTLIENAKKPLVLITYTNDSLDKFLLKISAYTSNILRFGSQSRLPQIAKFNINFETTNEESVNPHLKRLYYTTNEEFKAKFKIVQEMQEKFDYSDDSYQHLQSAQRDVSDVAEKLKIIRLMFKFYAAKKADVIAMTSTCAAKSNFLFRLLQCKIVVFEEAAEILEPHILSCLTPYTEHVIMIGDHMQLQPYTSSYHHSRTSHLNISLFERLFVSNLKGPTLHIQYRMRSSIAELIHPMFYEELNNDESVENYPKIRCMGKNVYFFTHTVSEEQKDYFSVINVFEINQIINLARHLVEKAEYTLEDIVILSPYAKQVEYLKKKAQKNKSINQLNIATVDSFQGLEANIVLLSLVRSNTSGEIGFLREKNRICVALSRAKHGLYIIGNMSLLAKLSKTWREIQLKLETQSAIGNKFPLSDEK